MGAYLCLCAPWHPKSNQKSESFIARDEDISGSNSTSLNSKTDKQRKLSEIFRRKISEEKINMAEKLTLQDWILASPGLKPEYLLNGEHSASKQSKKKVHPCVSQFHGSGIAEAKDSLCLDRPMNRYEEEEDEGMSNCSSSISISTRLIGKSEKKVSFKLPHVEILYSPEEEEEEEQKHDSSDSEDSFSSMGPNSFDSAEEPMFRLAVDILPHVFVSSKI